MTLPSSGTITAAMINEELGRSSNASFNLNDPDVRALAGKPSGAISFSDFYNKSGAFTIVSDGHTSTWDSGGWRYYEYWFDGSVTVSGKGTVEVTLIGTGGGGASGRYDGGSGAGGLVRPTSVEIGWNTYLISPGYIVGGNAGWPGWSASNAVNPYGYRGNNSEAFGLKANGGGAVEPGNGGCSSGTRSTNGIGDGGYFWYPDPSDFSQGSRGATGKNVYPGLESQFTGGGGGGMGIGPYSGVGGNPTDIQPGFGGDGGYHADAFPGWNMSGSGLTNPFGGGGGAGGGQYPTYAGAGGGLGGGGLYPGRGRGEPAEWNSCAGAASGGFRADYNYGGGATSYGCIIFRYRL